MDNQWSEAHGWSSLQRWVFEAQNSTAGVPASCLAVYAVRGEAWRCFFAQYAAPTIKLPLFALQPMYDAYQVGAEIGSHDPSVVNAYGKNLTLTLKEAVLGANPENGAYLDGCLHHGGGWPAMQAQAPADHSWASPIDAFTMWYTGLASTNNESSGEATRVAARPRYWQTPSSGRLPNGRLASNYPCQACCPCRPNRTSSNFNAGCKVAS